MKRIEKKRNISRIGLFVGLMLLFCVLGVSCACAQTLTLPSAIKMIEEEAFMGDTALTEVIVPEGAASIGARAFAGCSGLVSIIIPDSVTSFGTSAFDGCEDLYIYCSEGSAAAEYAQTNGIAYGREDNNVVPAGLKYSRMRDYIRIDGYSGTEEKLILPDCIDGIRVKEIGPLAFCDNTIIHSVQWPKYLEKISDYAFENCTNFSGDLIFPASLLEIGSNAFHNCPIGGRLVLPQKLEMIGAYAFQMCTFEGDLIIPDSVSSIGSYAFDRSTFSGTLDLSENLQIIENYAFNCYGFSGDLIIPDSVVSIGMSAFGSPGWVYDMPNRFDRLVLSENLESIGSGAFGASYFSGDLIIPDSVLEIGEGAFSYCAFNGKLKLPKNLSIIDEDVFNECRFIGSLILPEKISKINSSAFYGNCFEGDLIIPDSVTEIGSLAFGCCAFDGSLKLSKNLKTIGQNAFYEAGFSGKLIIPNSVTEIGNSAFSKCGFNHLTLSENMTQINHSVFYQCGFEGNLRIPDSVHIIQAWAFADCMRLQSVYIPESVDIIGDYLFHEDIIIYGEAGSRAESYAQEHGLAFSTDPFPGHLEDDVWVTLSGRVLLPDGSAAGGVSVSLYKGTGGALAGYGTTDTDGRWSVSKLEPDTSYRIVCHKNGLAFAEMTFTATLEQTVVPDITAMTGDVYLTTDVAAIRAEAAAGSTAVRVTSSGAWTAQTQNEWITLSAQSGVSGDTLTISYSANSDKLRVGFVALTADGLTQRIPVVQIGEASFRLPDPTITTPAENGMELPYASLRVEWTSVPDADHYVISLRDTTTNELLIHHERPEDGTGCVAVLPASFFFMGRSYRIAVGAVPPGMDSSDSTVSWCERTFSVPAQELASDATILGRVCEYEYIDEGENLEMNKHPLANVTVDLYRIGDTSKTHEGTFTTGESGEFTFTGCAIDQVYSLELTSAQQAFASVSGARIAEIFGKSVSKAQEDLLENSAYVIRTEAGENQTGDVTGVPKLGEGHQAWYKKMISGKPHGLWAEYFQFEDGEKNNIFFDGNKYKTYNEYKRWEYGSDEKEIVREINFRWENDTPNKYNALYTTEYDGSGTGLPIRYMFKDNFAAQFNGYLQVPETNTYTFRLTGDDGIRLSLELPYVENGYEKLRQLGGAKWHNIGYAKDFTTSDVMIAADTIMPLNIQYYNKTGVAKLKFEYRTSTDKKWRIVPAEWLYLGRRTCMIDDSWLEPAETMEELDARVEAAFDTMADKTISSFIGDIIGDTIEPVIFAKWDDQKFNSVSEKFVTTAYQGVAKTGFNVVCDFIVDGALDAEDFTAEEAWKKIVDSLPYVKEDADEYGLDTSKLGEDAFASFVRLMQLIYDRDHNFYNELEVSFENFVLFDQCEKSMTGEIGAGIINGFVEACPALDAVKMLRDYLNAIKVERDSNRLRSWIHMSIIENMDQYAGEKNHQIFMGTRVYRVLLDAARASHSAGAALYNTVNVLPGVSGSIYYLDALDQSSNDHLYRYFNSLYDRNPDERLLKQLLIDVIDATSSEYGNMLGGIL